MDLIKLQWRLLWLTTKFLQTQPTPHGFVKTNLFFSAIVGFLTLSIIPLFKSATTFYEVWTFLANTYAKHTQGHIERLKINSNVLVKDLLAYQNICNTSKHGLTNLLSKVNLLIMKISLKRFWMDLMMIIDPCWCNKWVWHDNSFD